MIHKCSYWEPKYPRLVTREQAKTCAPRLIALGDLGCDIGGPFEFFSHSTRIDAPFYMVNLRTGEEHNDLADPSRESVLVYGVDHIPGELAADASTFFGDRLVDYIPMLALHDQRVPYDKIVDLPPHVRNAMLVRHGTIVGRNAARMEASIAANAGVVSAARDAADMRD